MPWFALIALIGGFIALLWSADRFLSGAANTARNSGVSKILIGLTVVSLGTSAPEILVALSASFSDRCVDLLTAARTHCGRLAVGNAIGSNIANIGLVLGLTAILRPLPFSPSVLRTELPWLITATLLALVCLYDLQIDGHDSILLLTALALVILALLRGPWKNTPGTLEELDELPYVSTRVAVFQLVSGLLVLLVAAEVLVWAAATIALSFGISEMIIGLTIIAIGTSLPELAATVASAMKGHPDIAIGNVLGSNILNILAVMAVPGLIVTTNLEPAALWRDYGMMLAMTLLLVLFAYGINSRAIITRFEGSVMLVAWGGYTFLLVHQAAQ